jgi:hypothetical protein
MLSSYIAFSLSSNTPFLDLNRAYFNHQQRFDPKISNQNQKIQNFSPKQKPHKRIKLEKRRSVSSNEIFKLIKDNWASLIGRLGLGAEEEVRKSAEAQPSKPNKNSHRRVQSRLCGAILSHFLRTPS